VEEAWLFLNSDALNRTLYQHGCIIPCKQELMEDAPLLLTENTDQWKAISDLTNYTVAFAVPDSVLNVEGETYDTVFSSIIRDERDWTEDLIADLETRYNAAYQVLKGSSPTEHSLYSYSYSHEKEREELP